MPKTQSKTIWYCHHYAGSPSLGMSYRPYYLSREFFKQGHNAFIICADFHHLLLQPQVQQDRVVKKIIDDVPFVFLKARPYEGNGLSRILNMWDYAQAFKKEHKAIVNLTAKPDVIIVSSAHPFHFPILKKIANQYNAKLIFEVRDLWPLSLQVLLSKSVAHPLVLYLSWLEKKAYKHANHVVSVLKNSLDFMKKRGLKKEKFYHIPNGVSLDEQIESASLPDFHQKIIDTHDNEVFKLGYAGALGEPNAMCYLLDAMHLLQKRKVLIHLFIVGDGHLKTQLEHQSQELGLTNITFLSRISKNAIPTFLKQMDALYLGWQPSQIYQYGVSPNKLFDYMASSKPIIESGGDSNGIVKEAKCGFQCEPGKPEQIANIIELLYRLPKEEKIKLGNQGMDYVKKHDYAKLANEFSKLF